MAEHLVLQVEGMTCTGCEQRIDTVLRRVDGVREVRADHTSGQVAVRLDPAETDRRSVVARIEQAGYRVVEHGDAGGGAR
ncbi:hypothetical protein BH20ACT7_BH20ACT7_15570 [soil metagenome]